MVLNFPISTKETGRFPFWLSVTDIVFSGKIFSFGNFVAKYHKRKCNISSIEFYIHQNKKCFHHKHPSKILLRGKKLVPNSRKRKRLMSTQMREVSGDGAYEIDASKTYRMFWLMDMITFKNWLIGFLLKKQSIWSKSAIYLVQRYPVFVQK